MEKEIIVFDGCYTGTDFENKVVCFLNSLGISAKKTGRNDGGIDIVATKSIQGNEYKFYIQCKYFNNTVGKHPIQEVFAGANYYEESSGKGIPVVITNNRVTREARLYAKRLGVEIIADAEWAELRQIYQDKKIVNPNTHHGLFGIIIVTMLKLFRCEQAEEYKHVFLSELNSEETCDDRDSLVLTIQDEFDRAEEFIKESTALYQRAAQNQQKEMNLHRDAIIRHLKYG